MPDTFQALGVFILAFLPGALHTWAFEREVGRWGAGVADRVLRFIGTTAIFQLLFAVPLYWAWKNVWHVRYLEDGVHGFKNLLAEGDAVPSCFWLLCLLYVAVPIAAGTLAGISLNRWPGLSRILVGKDPAPRAWDFLWSKSPRATVRLRLKDGGWVGGFFSSDSYAGGYAEQPLDLFLEKSYAMNPDDGSFLPGPDDGYDPIGSGVLIRWEEIQVMEVFR